MSTRTNSLQVSFQLKVFILLLAIALIVLMFPKGESLESEVNVGSIWIQDDLIASQTFEILKDADTYGHELLTSAENVIWVFNKDEQIPIDVKDSLEAYNVLLLDLLDRASMDGKELKNSFNFISAASLETFVELRKNENLFTRRERKTMNDVFNISRLILSRIYQRGYLSIIYEEIEKDSIGVRTGKFEKGFPKRIYLDRNSVNVFISAFLRNNFSTNAPLNNAISEYLNHFLKPDIIYSSQATEEAIQLARNKVSRNIGIVNENERIVAKHDRITPLVKLKIDSYRIAKGEDTGYWERFSQGMGKFLHIVIVLGLFVIYIYLFRKKIFYDNYKILLIIILILLMSFVTFIVGQINVSVPVEHLIFIPVASMLLTIIFDSRIGFYGTVVIALIAAGLRGNDYVFAVTNIFAGALGAYTVRDIKNRSQIFRSFLFILLGYVTSILAFGLERFDGVQAILIASGFAATNALISPVLTYGLIIFFEKSFKITTDLTLLELTDFNSPLLKELARNAPGTFNHSMTIGSLVENAAVSVGANPLLARVGAYYHDIGKTVNPTGFVENQLNNNNLHDGLKPENSSELIIDHVKSGMELGREYNLPDEIIDFIPMHHGTMVVQYFYEKAKGSYGEDKVNINDFRYPGPKPNSKETALVMLADACESAVRAMKEPEPKKVESLINSIFKSRIEDGQLDEAPITFHDISRIKEAFMSILIGQHHKRIRYPKQDEMEQNTEAT
ncbi:MAG: HDIG domain-containing protein [Bacteroidetes bacterium]|nr:HDIG domain-containing protein [Bacteroidota bacterium]